MAYLALIQTYKDNDSRFSVEEANQLTKYIKSNKAGAAGGSRQLYGDLLRDRKALLVLLRLRRRD